MLYVPNITQGVQDVLSGRVDVTFARADLLVKLQAQGQLTAVDFKTLAPVSFTTQLILVHICTAELCVLVYAHVHVSPQACVVSPKSITLCKNKVDVEHCLPIQGGRYSISGGCCIS